MEGIAERVAELVAKCTGVSVSQLNLHTDLLGDLGVDGADAEELLEEFCAFFGVDAQAIEFDRHFGPEGGFNPFALLFPSWWAWHKKRIPVTIETLVRAAETECWPVTYESEL